MENPQERVENLYRIVQVWLDDLKSNTYSRLLLLDFSYFYPLEDGTYDLYLATYSTEDISKLYFSGIDDFITQSDRGKQAWEMFDLSGKAEIYEKRNSKNWKQAEDKFGSDNKETYKYFEREENGLKKNITIDNNSLFNSLAQTAIGKEFCVFCREFRGVQVSVFLYFSNEFEGDLSEELRKKIEEFLIQELISISIRRNWELNQFKSWALAQNHSLKSLNYNTPLRQAHSQIQRFLESEGDRELIERAKKNIETTSSMLLIQENVLDFIFGNNKESKGRTLSELLYFFKEHYETPEVITELDISHTVDPVLDSRQWGDYFIIIFNLWSNGSKPYSSTNCGMRVSTSESEDHLIIIFSNQPAAEASYIDFLNRAEVEYPDHNSSSVSVEKKYKGLNIVKQLCQKLEIIIQAEILNGETCIHLKLPIGNENTASR